jgi:hypothetical protein
MQTGAGAQEYSVRQATEAGGAVVPALKPIVKIFPFRRIFFWGDGLSVEAAEAKEVEIPDAAGGQGDIVREVLEIGGPAADIDSETAEQAQGRIAVVEEEGTFLIARAQRDGPFCGGVETKDARLQRVFFFFGIAFSQPEVEDAADASPYCAGKAPVRKSELAISWALRMEMPPPLLAGLLK